MLLLSRRLGIGRDAKLMIASVGVASLSGGFAGVVQNIYLSMLGFDPIPIGIVVSVAAISGTLRSVLFGILSDRLGRKKALVLIYFTSILYYLIYFMGRDYPLFILAAIIGGAGGEGYGGNVEGSLLAEKVDPSKRNIAFSIQYFIGSSLSALGSFVSGLPEAVANSSSIPLLDAIRLVYILQAGLIAVAASLVIFIDEPTREEGSREQRYLSREARKKILKLSAYGAVDGFGVGLFINLASLWFYLRFGIELKSVGYIFAFSKLIESTAYLAGPSLANKKGLVWMLSAARFGGAISVAIMAFMPSYVLAAVMYTARNSIQHIGTSLRTSYTLAIFDRRERASAASIGNISMSIAMTVATSIQGYLMQSVDLFIPPFLSSLFVGGASLLYYRLFKDTKPPEEQTSTKSHMA